MGRAGSGPRRDGVVRWRCVDLQLRISRSLPVQLHERTAGKLLRRLLVPAAVGASAAPAEQARGTSGFQHSFADLVTAALPPQAAGRPVEIWFTDEARVGQQGTLDARVAKRGSRPRALRDRRFEWAYLFSASCPERRVGAAIVMPEVNIEAMNEHLATISRRVSVGAIALLVLDGAGCTARRGSTCRRTSCCCHCRPTRPN